MFNSNLIANLDDLKNLNDTKHTARKLTKIKYNYCEFCNIAMERTSIEYYCLKCGQVKDYEEDIDHDSATAAYIKITTGSRKGKYYNMTTDYCKIQRKNILNYLRSKYNNLNSTLKLDAYSPHIKKIRGIPMNVLNEVADKYNEIQKNIVQVIYDENGNKIGQKKFVRRRTIKDEILAALIYYTCIKNGAIRKKRDVSQFMGLNTDGFSRGEDILRTLNESGEIDIELVDETVECFIDRYLDELKIYCKEIQDDKYVSFVKELVQYSEEINLGMNSQLSSKVIGAIWILICKFKLNITADQVEIACDNTKKNTFVKFSKLVIKNEKKFAHLFKKYSV